MGLKELTRGVTIESPPVKLVAWQGERQTSHDVLKGVKKWVTKPKQAFFKKHTCIPQFAFNEENEQIVCIHWRWII